MDEVDIVDGRNERGEVDTLPERVWMSTGLAPLLVAAKGRRTAQTRR
jgi:hypothetical protein